LDKASSNGISQLHVTQVQQILSLITSSEGFGIVMMFSLGF
jgi:hypothetical protein